MKTVKFFRKDSDFYLNASMEENDFHLQFSFYFYIQI